jgi:hypothetical protein
MWRDGEIPLEFWQVPELIQASEPERFLLRKTFKQLPHIRAPFVLVFSPPPRTLRKNSI